MSFFPLDPEPDGAALAQAIAHARRASEALAAWSLGTRVAAVAQLQGVLVSRQGEIVERLTALTGKPPVEVLSGELVPVLSLLKAYRETAAQVLAPSPRPGHLLFPRTHFKVTYAPLGAVVVFAPWNYPLQLALVPALTALFAGNAVLIKPSEKVPGIGALLRELLGTLALPEGAVQVVEGGPKVGRALIEAGPDKVFFTGSTRTGRAVMAACAERLIPLSLELGGKDPMVVFADAPFWRAIKGALYGAFANAGQVCVSVERLLVERSLYPRFARELADAACGLKVGSGPEDHYGPLIDPDQAARVESQLEDALAQGARLLTPRWRQGLRMGPLVLADVTPAMRVFHEETFGPLVTLTPFDTEAEAVALANGTEYGLAASVWTQDSARAARVAAALRCGHVAINDVLKTIAHPHTPFGGTRASGFGRAYGPEGLLAFSQVKTIATNDGLLPTEPNYFGGVGLFALRTLVSLHFGEGVVGKATAAFQSLRKR